MLNPGGGVSQSEGAKTRFNNDLQRAAASTVQSNPAAAASLQRQVKTKGNASSAPVGSNRPVRAPSQPAVGAPQQFQSAPAGPMLPDFGREINPKDLIPGEVMGLVNNAKIEKLMTSPEMQGAMTSMRLHDHFNEGNPKSNPDLRPTIERVLNRLKLTYEDL